MGLGVEDYSYINIKIQELLNDMSYQKSIYIPSDISFVLSDQITFSDLSKLNRKGIDILFQDRNNSIKDFGDSIELKESVKNNSFNDKSNIEEFSQYFLEQITESSFDYMIDTITATNVSVITQANIPQFSNFDDGTTRLIKTLRKAGDYGPVFDDLGQYLTGPGKKAAAYKKYGENHSKLAALFDLVYIVRKDGANKVYLTELGKAVEKIPEEKLRIIYAKLAVKIPIIKSLIMDAVASDGNIEKTLSCFLAQSTILRRRSNVRYLINLIKHEYDGVKYKRVLESIV